MTAHPRTKRFYIFLGILVLAGILIRLVVSAQLVRADTFVSFPPPEEDQATYLAIADRIAEQGEWPRVFYYQPFYNSVFLPAARLLFRSRSWSPALAQTLCAGAIIWLAGLIAAQLRGRLAGLCAGAFAAFSSLLILYVPYALIEIQQCLWITLFLYLLLRAARRKKPYLWACAGAVLAFSVLSRGNSLCFLPAAALALFHAYRGAPKRAVAPVLLFLAFLMIPQIPFILRNSLASGCLSGPSTAGPAVLALGNSPEAPPGGLDYPETYRYWMDHQDSRSVPGRIFDWACAEPAVFLELQIRKFFLFWDSGEIPNNISVEYNGGKSPLFRSCRFLPTGFLLFCFAAAFFLSLKTIFHKKKEQVFYLSVLLYAAATAAFYILARFRVPALGLIAAGAGFLPADILRTVRKKDRHGLFFLFLSCIVSLVLVYLLFPVYSSSYEPGVMRRIRPGGVAVFQPELGQLDVRDNGSLILHGDFGIPLKNGLVIEKTFVLPEGTSGIAQELLIATAAPGKERFLVSIDGGLPIRAEIAKDSNMVFPVAPRPLSGGEVKISVRFTGVAPDSRACVFADLQRNYGRTRVNGEILEGEAVMRLRLRNVRMEEK